MKDIKILVNYNFNLKDLNSLTDKFEKLFTSNRRDSCFAFVYENGEDIYAIRDHFGQIPLYYRIFPNGEIRFSIHLVDLLDSNCELDFEGLKYYLAFGTSKIHPPFKEIKSVPSGSVIKLNKITKNVDLLYSFKPKATKYNLKSFKDYVNKFEELFMRAIQRTIKNKEVGLLLSGGIDSGLTGYYLKKLGVEINAYTSAPWGRKSSEIKFSKINAKIIGVKNHFISYLEASDYLSSFSKIFSIYKTIHGTSTSLGIAKLYTDFPIEKELQVYYAQNCDTANCSMTVQNIAFFSKFIPFFGYLLNKNLSYQDPLRNYLNFFSNGLLNENEEFKKRFNKLPVIEKLSLAGIFLVHSQSDSEVINEPLIAKGVLVSNPFFDVDLVEFFLGIPLKYRLDFSIKEKTKIFLDKKIVRQLAIKFLPEELVFRKKGFNIPIEKFFKGVLTSLPERIIDLRIKNLTAEQKFSLKVFMEWCKKFNVKLIKY